MSALDDDDNKEDVGFVLHFTTTDDHEDDKSLDEIPEDEEEHETGEVISQKSLHLLSMTHQTFVNVVQFDQGQSSCLDQTLLVNLYLYTHDQYV